MYNRLTLHLNKVLSLITTLVLFSSGSMLAQGFSSITPLNSIGITASTDEKPQSKVWTHDGKWWMVMPNSSGTHIFRLDGTTWTSVLNIDPSTNVHADCKVVGNVTHILLYKGENSSLVSVEYSSNTYQLWSSRSTTSPISLDSGVSTATIDIDGNGRMWLASDAGSEINVRWSDTPYTTWSAPITIESGVNNDDICLVTAFDGKIGVLWSNQNTQRFGFKYHIDGDSPATWSIDEVPASQSAQNQGFGMADDHLNIAVASDGTLYTAIKTSYNTYGFPRIALLVRRPSGNWDNLYEVSQYGTRPIAILNEVEGKIKILYTSFENSGDILYKESPIPNISFSSVFTLINGSNNNASSTKQNYTDEVVVLASTGSVLSSVIASDLIGTSPPSTPLLVLPNDHSSEIAIAPTLKWEAVGTADSYHVQVSTQSDFTTLVHDQSNITSTSTTLFPELANNTEYYWRVNATNTYGNSDWSSVWSFTTGLLGDHLMAHWEMDNSQGTVLEDATLHSNDAITASNPSIVPGLIGNALQLNGSSQYATASNSSFLDITNAITLAVWIKPANSSPDTQNIIKKSITSGNNIDGYELSLSGNGNIFFRLNKGVSGNTYRIESTSDYPLNGSEWMHIAATFDGTIMKLYINGVQEGGDLPGPISGIASNTLPVGIGAMPNGRYTFQGLLDDVRVYDKALTEQEVISLMIHPPSVPNLISPNVYATEVNTTSTLEWDVSEMADTYHVQVSTQPDFSTTVFDQSDITTTSITITPELLNNTEYYWRVNATNTNGKSDWSSLWSFTTEAPITTLVAHWQMDESTGSILADATSFANNATTTSSPSFVTGLLGNALQLDGSSQYATANTSSSLNISQAITLAAWIKPADVIATNQSIIQKSITTSNPVDGYELSLSDSGKVYFQLNQGTNGNAFRLNSTTNYPLNGSEWMHIAATFDGTTMRLYINGVQDGDGLSGPTNGIASNTLAIGVGATPDGQNLYSGLLDDLRIYDGALSDADILALTITSPPLAPNLISPMDLAIDVNTSPILEWESSETADTYQVQISTQSDFNTLVYDESNLTSTNINPTLVANTIYYWRVNATNVYGDSGWSSIWIFSTEDVDTSLVAHWKMNETTGNILTDATSNANDASTISNPSFTLGKLGNALQLDGSSQYATVPHSSSMDITNAITLAVWIKPTNSSPDTQNIIKKSITSGNSVDGYELSLSGRGYVSFRLNKGASGNTYRLNSTTDYPLNGSEWMHIAATFDGTTMKLYINGVQEGGDLPGPISGIASNTLPVGIGAMPNGRYSFQGLLDDARIYNQALTEQEVMALLLNPPSEPYLIAPSDIAIDVNTTPTLEWEASATADTYQVQISTQPDFSTIVYDQSGITTTSTTVTPELLNSTTYYWRVNATNTYGTSDWSSVWSFTTEAPITTLVAHWQMDESTGNILTDATSFANDATTTSSPSFVTGLLGNALQLDGSSQYATANTSSSLNISQAITLAAWIKPADVIAANQSIIQKSITTSNPVDGYELSLSDSGKVYFQLNQGTNGNAFRLNSTTNYPLNGSEWMHITATFDGTTMRLYINGVQEGGDLPGPISGIASNTLPIGIGATPDGQNLYSGLIDDLRIYDGALSDADILALTITSPPLAPNLISPMDLAIDVNTSPILEWESSETADTYQVQISTQSDFSIIVFDESDITNTTVSPELLNTTDYFWRVNATNIYGVSDWSLTRSFTTEELASSLVAHWKMNETTGNILTDATSNANHASTISNPSFTLGKLGNALQLDRSSQYATVPHSSSMDITNAITLAVWIKPTNSSPDTQNIIKKSITSGNSVDGYELSLSGNGSIFFRLNKGANGNTYRLNSTTDYPLNGSEWMHIAATFDGTTMKLYINGVQEGGDLPGPISGIASNTSPVGIGAMPNGRYSFQGLLDDARIYNQALTEQEIMALLLNPPSEPYLIAPSDIAVDVNTTPTLEWEASATADTYQVQISTQPDFSTIVYDQSGITTTSTTVTPELLNSTTYYWRVNATNTYGTSDWSSVWNFTTEDQITTLAINENSDSIVEQNTLEVFSSFSEKAVYINGVVEIPTKVTLFDMQGRKMLSQSLNLSSNSNRIELSSLKPGI